MCLIMRWNVQQLSLQNFKVKFDEVALATNSNKQDCFFTEMRKLKVSAEDPVVQVTAWLLHLDTVVISEGSKESNPYLLIPGERK